MRTLLVLIAALFLGACQSPGIYRYENGTMISYANKREDAISQAWGECNRRGKVAKFSGRHQSLRDTLDPIHSNARERHFMFRCVERQ